MNLADAPISPTKVKMRADENTSRIVNPYTKGLKHVRMPGATWVMTLSYSKMSPQEANWFDAYLSFLRGGATTTRVPDASYTYPVGEISGSPVVKTDGVDGRTLETSGWDPDIVDQVVEGTKFSFIDADTGLEELHIVTQKASSDSSGELTLVFTPELKRLPLAGVALNFSSPGFSATLEKQSSGVTRQRVEATCSVEFREALYDI